MRDVIITSSRLYNCMIIQIHYITHVGGKWEGEGRGGGSIKFTPPLILQNAVGWLFAIAFLSVSMWVSVFVYVCLCMCERVCVCVCVCVWAWMCMCVVKLHYLMIVPQKLSSCFNYFYSHIHTHVNDDVGMNIAKRRLNSAVTVDCEAFLCAKSSAWRAVEMCWEKLVVMSFMKMTKKLGEITSPCGTPSLS